MLRLLSVSNRFPYITLNGKAVKFSSLGVMSSADNDGPNSNENGIEVILFTVSSCKHYQ